MGMGLTLCHHISHNFILIKNLYLIGKEKYNMNISFADKKLGKIMNSEKELQKNYGKNARYIMRRMMVLSTAPSLAHISHKPPERRHELEGQRKGSFAVDIRHPFRLVFKPNHNPVPLKEDTGIDLNKVTAITILEVEDYH